MFVILRKINTDFFLKGLLKVVKVLNNMNMNTEAKTSFHIALVEKIHFRI